jgi:hypothetical protein
VATQWELPLGRITEELFTVFMGKVDSLVSIEEFTHLKKYKDELKEKKRY